MVDGGGGRAAGAVHEGGGEVVVGRAGAAELKGEVEVAGEEAFDAALVRVEGAAGWADTAR